MTVEDSVGPLTQTYSGTVWSVIIDYDGGRGVKCKWGGREKRLGRCENKTDTSVLTVSEIDEIGTRSRRLRPDKLRRRCTLRPPVKMRPWTTNVGRNTEGKRGKLDGTLGIVYRRF